MQAHEGNTVEFDLLDFEEMSKRGQAALAGGRCAEAAELLRAALANWHGHALSGVTRQLATAEQPRLEEARLLTLEQCIDAELALGKHGALIAELTALVAAEPLRERPCMQLMSALYRCGRTADALAVFHNFRAHLADSLGLDPSSEMQQLHQSILTSELDVPFAATELAHAQPAGQGLRPEPSDFVGRDAETAMAFAVLADPVERDTPPSACAIIGPSGAGKSTFAMRIARLLRPRFPDRQVLVPLDGASASPPDRMTVLGTALTRLGLPPDRQPGTLYGRVEAYRGLLAGTRTLLVLDDAADERQVRCLHPGDPGCGVLITSRFSLAALEGTTRISLNVFSPGESVDLLSKIIGPVRTAAEPAAARRVTQLCGYLPGAVRISGAILAARSHWSIERLADRLADPRRRLAELRIGDLDVRDFLVPAYAQLPDRISSALLTLASNDPGPFTGAQAAEMLGEAEPDALDLLDELVAAHFLTIEPGMSGHYRMPELVLAFAVSQALVLCAS